MLGFVSLSREKIWRLFSVYIHSNSYLILICLLQKGEKNTYVVH